MSSPENIEFRITENMEDTSMTDVHNETFEKIKKKLGIIKYININDKLSIDINGDIYIDKYQWGQCISRMYYAQNREKTQGFLDSEFTPFIKFLDEYLHFIEHNSNIVLKTLNYGKFTNRICIFY